MEPVTGFYMMSGGLTAISKYRLVADSSPQLKNGLKSALRTAT